MSTQREICIFMGGVDSFHNKWIRFLLVLSNQWSHKACCYNKLKQRKDAGEKCCPPRAGLPGIWFNRLKHKIASINFIACCFNDIMSSHNMTFLKELYWQIKRLLSLRMWKPLFVFVKRLLNIFRLCLKQMFRVNASDTFKHFWAWMQVQGPSLCRVWLAGQHLTKLWG